MATYQEFTLTCNIHARKNVCPVYFIPVCSTSQSLMVFWASGAIVMSILGYSLGRAGLAGLKKVVQARQFDRIDVWVASLLIISGRTVRGLIEWSLEVRAVAPPGKFIIDDGHFEPVEQTGPWIGDRSLRGAGDLQAEILVISRDRGWDLIG